MTDRTLLKETIATGAAFRAGVRGIRYTEHPDPTFDMPVVTDTSPGPNERHFETVERLPGLSDPEAAYETGRALRMIGHIMDTEGSPPEHAQVFLQLLANAVLYFGLRGERQPWGADDTAFVFLENVKGPTEAIEAMRRAILTYAAQRPVVRSGRLRSRDPVGTTMPLGRLSRT